MDQMVHLREAADTQNQETEAYQELEEKVVLQQYLRYADALATQN